MLTKTNDNKAEQIHEESPSDAVSEQEQAELLGAQMLQEALQMLESRKELAESVASLPASSKQVEQTQADEQLESTIEGASRKELAKEAEVAEDRRSLNTEELSSLFDYADELQTAKHLELNKSDSAVDVDQLLFIRSQGLSMSSPTSVRSPNSPTNTSLTDSSSSSLIVGRLGEQAQSEECPQQQENSVKDDQKQEKDQNGEPWAPNGQFGEPETVAGEDKSCTNGHDEVDEDFCGAQQASEVKLRQLRMSTLEDVSVCGQNRHSAEAARRLFDSLCRSQKGQQAANGNTARGRDRHSATRRRNRGVSLDGSSGNSELGEEELRSSLSSNQEEMNGPSLDQSHGSFRASVIDIGIGAEDNDCGYIKLVRRCGSSAGASSSSGNYGRTLVCSVSPTGQQHQQVFPAASPVAFDGSQLSSSTEDRQEGMGVSINGDDLSLYPIDGDEIRQCRAAFRENRRLIEKAARLASSCDRQSSANFDGSTWSAGMMQANGRHPEGSMGSNRSRWANTLQRIRPLPHCTRCQQRLYPVDKLELDFTKTTLNIHRNCFRCQVCSSMLR